MHYDEKVYRPPTEAYTPLLQVTSGCSHNKCTFCNMYEGVKFKTSPISEIKEDLEEIRMTTPNTDRIYLLNGDPFVLSFGKLKEIALLIREYLPKCETITMYASINSVKNKSVEELKELRSLGINDLYFGIETGHDETLSRVNKGNTSNEAKEQLQKLNKANMDFLSIIMYGIAGSGKGKENAIATAKLLNSVETIGIGSMNLNVMEGTPLYEENRRGDFKEATDLEKLEELRTLIEHLDVRKEAFFTSVHISNLVSLDGRLPEDKDRFLKDLDNTIEGIKSGRIRLMKKDFFGSRI